MSNPYEPPTPSPPEPRRKAAIGAGGRLAMAFAVLLVFVFVTYPRPWYDLAPAQIVIGGPFMWVVLPVSKAKVGGAAVATALLIGMGAVIVWPRWYTVIISTLAIAAWFGIGWLFWMILSHA